MKSISDVSARRICYSVKDTAEILCCSERLLRKEMAVGNLGFFRISRRVLISEEQLHAYIERNSVPPSSVVVESNRIVKLRALRA